jgi:hypothetical protein
MTDQETFAAKGTLIMLAGHTFELAQPTRRVARQWLSELMQIAVAMKGLSVPEDGEDADPGVGAAMFGVFEPICQFLGRCSPAIAHHATALDNATETELIQAFVAIKESIELPFAQPTASGQPTPKPSAETPHSNTSAGPGAISIGSPAPTS